MRTKLYELPGRTKLYELDGYGPYTLEEIISANADAPISEADVERISRLFIRERFYIGGGACAKTLIVRVPSVPSEGRS